MFRTPAIGVNSGSTASFRRDSGFKGLRSYMKQPWQRDNPRTRGGFTLLEILIAVFIFALIVSAIFTAYRGTFNVIEDTESQEDIYHMARVALERIIGDLEAAYSPESARNREADRATSEPVLFQGGTREINDLRCSELRFLSLAHLSFSDERPLAQPAEIAYYGAAAGIDGTVLDLYRSDTLLTHERAEPETGGLLLCKGLSTVDILYYDADGNPSESWNSVEGASEGKLPSRVSVRLEFPNPTDPERPLRFMTGVAIPMGG